MFSQENTNMWQELQACQEQGQDQVHPRPEVQCISRQDAAVLEGLLQCTTHSTGDLVLISERPRMGYKILILP